MKNKFYKILCVVAVVGIVLSPSALFAQDLGCAGADPYGNCPLDTWVIVLAGVTLLFAVVQLYRKQKAQPSQD